MEQVEIERLVSELELGLDRLRSLYEQYFMGIERIEPSVARKDIDRRVYVLRREQIRNTGLRFRFQMLLQRYNTFQSHWQRICREIENGTYKRHLARAQQRFGADTGAKVQGRRLTGRPSAPVPASSEADRLAAELAELEAEFAPALKRGSLVELDMVLDEAPPSLDPKGAPLPFASATARKPGLPPAPKPGQPPPLRAVRETTRVEGTAQAARRPPPPPAAASPARTAAPPAPGTGGASPPRAPAGQPPPLPSGVRSKATASPPARGPTAAPAGRPASAPPPRPPPAPEAAATRAAAPPAAAAVAKAAPPVARPAPAAAPKPGGDLPEERVRQIYAQYVDTKRQQNESTAAITYDAVARSLRDSSAKLREKHGKNVDFEVRVKDGKTILKPVMK